MRPVEPNELFIATSKVRFLALFIAASLSLTLGIVGCNKNGAQTTAPETAPQDTGAATQPAQTDQTPDPAAAANLAPAPAAPASTSQPTGYNDQQGPNDTDNDYADDDSSYGQPQLQAQQPPPPLPDYSQPDCPGDGYLWTPGYWSYAPQGYYWVPGAWTQPPQVG